MEIGRALGTVQVGDWRLIEEGKADGYDVVIMDSGRSETRPKSWPVMRSIAYTKSGLVSLTR